MRVVHLMASPFYGGPERQMLGLARHLPTDVSTAFLSFAEGGKALPFLEEARRHGFEAKALMYNWPRLFASIGEIAGELRRLGADLLCTSGYKPDILGWRAARRVGIPVVAIAHGWTGATWKVRCYERIDRWVMRRVDAVVCVSKAQGEKVRAAGVDETRVIVIQNAIGEDAFVHPDAEIRAEIVSWFAQPPRWLLGAAGRLSPEKGFHILIDAATLVLNRRPDAGFVVFGDGPLRAELDEHIRASGLAGRFLLAGFRNDLGRLLPNLDLGVMSSFTEGLPVTLLELSAAGVCAVATAVGGIPEVLDDGVTGWLVPPGDAATLAQRILGMLDDDTARQAMGQRARERVRADFSFAAMSQRYHELFERIARR